MKSTNHVSRRAALQAFSSTMMAGSVSGVWPAATLWAQEKAQGPPRVLPEAEFPDDPRLGPLKDLNGDFPFHVPESLEQWQVRADEVRRRILVSAGLWPMPTMPELIPVIHGTVDREEYTVDKVYFESVPGLYVTGSLYRPKGIEGPKPAVLSPHGHWSEGRFHDHGEDVVRQELESGAERFEVGGRHPLQARCVQLARMGCVVFLYDMLGYADSVPITFEIAHGFSRQRPSLSSPNRWGLFSAQAELRLQNVLGLQLLNSIRALDFLSDLPDVDPTRIAVTGASGGGTQTFLLSAVDPRPAAAFPAVMVSTAMQGGCTCENATYLRIGTGNVEFAALFAPRPLGLTGANDWTREIETKGLPELKRLYELANAPGNVIARYFDFGHNYNAQSRAMMYSFMAEQLGLGPDVSLEERDYIPLTREEATVWNEGHPKPPTDEDAEVRLLTLLDADSHSKMADLRPIDTDKLLEFQKIVGGAIRTMVGRSFPEAGDVVYDKHREIDRGDWLETLALLRYEPEAELVPTVFLYPKSYRGRVVVWVDEAGKSSLYDKDGQPIGPVRRLMDQGIAVVGCDLLDQGEWLKDDPRTQSRTVENPREFLGYTLGYNHPLFAQRVHDLLSVLAFVRHHDFSPGRVELVALSGAGRWAAAAAAVATGTLDAIALGTNGYRFGRIIDHRDPDLWPGALKYGDLPSLLALCAPTPLWVSGEGNQLPDIILDAYRATAGPRPDSFIGGEPQDERETAVTWLLDRQ
ncbi:alpha/beta hydrolase family protein [Tautonia marina]|uniref:alpha/beta hydrolase family protein n=1 Tax=Tautonia marina TaxID=2653855 RepID=UPI001260E58F|nr:acetylxylan esterase [Tautonia marina]